MTSNSTPLRVLVAAIVASGLAFTPLPSHAGIVEDVGATERINYSGKLRMLSQRIAAAACNYNAGISPETSRQILDAAGAEFEKIVDALEFGDAELHIKGTEDRRKTLHAIAALREQFEPVRAARNALLEIGSQPEASAKIASANMELLSRAKLLVSELVGQYSDPSAMVQADAMLVDISGRQRMLTQKMSKEACLTWSAGGDATAQVALEGTMAMFEISLLALREGMTDAGIKPAPTDEIRGGLDAIWDDWHALKPTLEEAVAGAPATPEVRETTFARLNVLLRDMNAVVGLYTIYAKSGL